MSKVVGDWLAEAGATQYEIMAIHGHSESRTSEVYTRGANRLKLAQQAMEAMSQVEW